MGVGGLGLCLRGRCGAVFTTPTSDMVQAELGGFSAKHVTWDPLFVSHLDHSEAAGLIGQ